MVITAEDRNDAPVLSGTVGADHHGDKQRRCGRRKPDFEGNTEDADPINEYNVMDEDLHAGIASWRLEGEDRGDFQLIETGGRTLVFKESPDYENPADADGDNVYKVTIVVRDNGGVEGRFDVCIDGHATSMRKER